MREITNKADGVRDDEWLSRGQGTTTGSRVERSKKFILSQYVRISQFVKQGGFACISVANDGASRHRHGHAFFTLGLPVLNNTLKFTFHTCDLSAHHSLIELKLSLTRITLHGTATSLAAEVCPRTFQTR